MKKSVTWVLIIIIFFSLIRLEFNQQHQDYYTELDAVFLYGIPAPCLSSAEQKPPTSSTGTNISLTARLLQKLSLKDDKDNSFQNGLFDILPVRLILLSSLWFLLMFFSCQKYLLWLVKVEIWLCIDFQMAQSTGWLYKKL